MLNCVLNSNIFIRGDAIPSFIEEQLVGLFGKFSDWMLNKYGFNIKEFLEFCRIIKEELEFRCECFMIMNDLLLEGEFKKAFNKISTNKGINNEERKFIKSYKRNKKEVQSFYTMKNGLDNYEGILKIQVSDFKEKLDINKFYKLVEEFTFDFNNKKQQIQNPTNHNALFFRPIIKFNDKYIVASYATLIHNVQKKIENNMKNEKIWDKYQKNKGNYLENETIKVFQKILPDCKKYNGLKYVINDNGEQKECELDSLIIYDNNIILVEAKSGIFHEKARQGAFRKLQTNIKENIEKAYLQADRARKYIKSSSNPEFFNSKSEKVVLDMKKYNNIYLINVTLENFGELSTMIAKTKEYELYSSDKFPWSVNINDLKVIQEFIQFPAQFLHYLKRRFALIYSKYDEPEIFSTDELDFLGNYLDGNLFFNNYKSYDMININDYAPYFNKYYNMKSLGEKTKKIGQIFDGNFKRIIDELHVLGGHGFTEIITKLLDLSSKGRSDIIQLIEKLTRLTFQDKWFHDGTFIIELANPNNKKSGWGLTIMTSYKKDRFELIERLKSYSRLKKYQQKCYEWIGIGVLVDDHEFLCNEYFYYKSEELYDYDLEALSNKILTKQMIKFKKVGRNEKCPCGSGLKYKNCHGKN